MSSELIIEVLDEVIKIKNLILSQTTNCQVVIKQLEEKEKKLKYMFLETVVKELEVEAARRLISHHRMV